MGYDPTRDYYRILQVNSTADPKVIAAAFRTLQLIFHPDRTGGSKEHSQLLNEAYEVLSDVTKRAEYDQLRQTFLDNQRAEAPKKAKPTARPSASPPPPKPKPLIIDFEDLLRPELMGREIEIVGMAASMDPTPYNCPVRVAFPFHDHDGVPIQMEYEFQPDNDFFVAAASGKGNVMERAARSISKHLHWTPALHGSDLRVLESATVRHFTLAKRAAGLLIDDVSSPFHRLDTYLVGTQRLEPGQDLRLRGFLKRHPLTNAPCLLATSAESIPPSFRTFKLTPARRTTFDIWAKTSYQSIVRQVETVIAKTVGRQQLTLGTLLALHSPLGFTARSINAERGWLEVGVLGDAGQAKSTTVRRILDAIGLGSFAGSGTAKRTGLLYTIPPDRQSIRWGLIPSNDQGLVALDEVQAMDPDVLDQLNSVRSEGVAEAVAAMSGRAHARTRIIWIFNPPNGNTMADYTHPVEALGDLFKPPFIRRLDLVIGTPAPADPLQAVKKRAAAYEKAREDKVPTWLTPAVLRDHVLWVWSRSPEQITFTEPAERALFKCVEYGAEEFGHCLRVPLCNPSDLPEKLARLSAAMAALRHSATPDHERIVVHLEDVASAYARLRALYQSPALDLAGLAAEARGTNYLPSEECETLTKWVRKAIRNERTKRGESKATPTTPKLLRYFLAHSEASATTLAELLGLSATGTRKKLSPYLSRGLLDKPGAARYRRARRFLLLLKHLRVEGII